MSSSHAARIAFLHSIKAAKGNVSEPAIRECVLSLARNRDVNDAIRLANRYHSSPHLSSAILQGISENRSGGVPHQLLVQIGPDTPTPDDNLNLMRIFAVKGIHPQHMFREKFVRIVRKAVENDSACIPLAIACLRRIKNERKFLWKLYIEQAGLDDTHLTANISQMAGINGWGEDRVRMILSRRSSLLSDRSAAMLIKALCHYPGNGSPALVNEIVSATESKDKTKESILSPVIEYHAVNKKFDAIEDLLKLSQPNAEVFGKILHHASIDEVQFFKIFSLMIDEFRIHPTPSMVRAGIDLALTSGSARSLVQILQSAHVAGVPVKESQMTRLVALTNSFQVPVRVRRRLRKLIKLIDPSFIS
jgi:hypothetical protein